MTPDEYFLERNDGYLGCRQRTNGYLNRKPWPQPENDDEEEDDDVFPPPR